MIRIIEDDTVRSSNNTRGSASIHIVSRSSRLYIYYYHIINTLSTTLPRANK